MDLVNGVLLHFKEYLFQYVATLVLIGVYFGARAGVARMVKRKAPDQENNDLREAYVRKLLNVGVAIVVMVIIGMIWEISLKGLSIYFASIFAVIGVGLFANWSILSNLTTSIILFFFYPHKIGDRIKLLDGDNSVEGEIVDISLFYIHIEGDDGKLSSFPNNVAIQKPVREL